MTAALLVFAVAACGSAVPEPASSAPATAAASPQMTPRETVTAVTPEPTVAPSPTPRCATETVVAVAGSREVRASANIFGAGLEFPPAPGGGGAGALPTEWDLGASAGVVEIPAASGCVTPIVGMAGWNGPGGDLLGPTDVASTDVISGIVHESNGMFLVGVFLGEGAPAGPAPDRLDATQAELLEQIEPNIGQTFPVGDGVGHRYIVPTGATRLFLGFADANGYLGPAGWYGNNSGALDVVVAVDGEVR
jgi:hypothetical protein